LLGGRALRAEALVAAGRIAAVTGAKLICETFTARLQRGAGRVSVDRLPYFGEQAAEFLGDFRTLVFCGTEPPVAFFAYPGKPSELSPSGAQLVRLASLKEDALVALTALADALGAPAEPAGVQDRVIPTARDRLNAHAIGAVLADLMPAGAIVSDEGLTASAALFDATKGAAPHDWLMVTGGAIGGGLPMATGAAVACPARQVIALQADGSGMYTCQALWTMARERLNVVTVIFNNASYAILNIELGRVGVQNPGPKALSMLSLDHPRLDWCALAAGMGVPAERVDSVAGFRAAFERALDASGPVLIEAML
jgi:acetolactate synthase-1/2/3 large subunit